MRNNSPPSTVLATSVVAAALTFSLFGSMLAFAVSFLTCFVVLTAVVEYARHRTITIQRAQGREQAKEQARQTATQVNRYESNQMEPYA
jgi:hypothetical protein